MMTETWSEHCAARKDGRFANRRTVANLEGDLISVVIGDTPSKAGWEGCSTLFSVYREREDRSNARAPSSSSDLRDVELLKY